MLRDMDRWGAGGDSRRPRIEQSHLRYERGSVATLTSALFDRLPPGVGEFTCAEIEASI